ncbi:MAG: class I SAM-dependent methyltransferase [Tannerellaceae bacterium]|jgi:SAM-dependent methyltransferase|nr:class I SAM-dependent methyltransferase [Tannerellaceae bacterium]
MSIEYTGTDNLEVMQKAENYNRFLLSLITRQHLATSCNILDIGAGIGLFAEAIRNEGFTVHCIEPDMRQATLLRSKGLPVSASIDQVADGSFDFIYAFNVLEHIEKDTEELELWASKLKQGGKLLIYVPAFNLLYSSMDKKVGHFRRYRRRQLTKMILEAGLTPCGKAEYADSLGFLITLLYKLVNRKSGNIDEKSLVFYDRILFPLSKAGDLVFRKLFGKNTFIVSEKGIAADRLNDETK